MESIINNKDIATSDSTPFDNESLLHAAVTGIAIASNNCADMKRRATKKTSLYRGVCWLPRRQAWRARIERNGNRIHIGYFASEIEAAKAYDKYSYSISGCNGRFNFPDDYIDQQNRRSDVVDVDINSNNNNNIVIPSSGINTINNQVTNELSESGIDHGNNQSRKRYDDYEVIDQVINIDSMEKFNNIKSKRRRTSASSLTTTSSSTTMSSPRNSYIENDFIHQESSINSIETQSKTPPFTSRMMIPQSPITPVSGSREYTVNVGAKVSPSLLLNNKLLSISPLSANGCDKQLLFHDDFQTLPTKIKLSSTVPSTMITNTLNATNSSLIMNAIFEEIRRPSTVLYQALIQRYR